jgi:hypothetical protein
MKPAPGRRVGIPFLAWFASLWRCRKGHKKVPLFEHKFGADWPSGYFCPRCGQVTELDGRFVEWR